MNDFTCQQLINELTSRLVYADNQVSIESMETLRDLLINELGMIEWDKSGCPVN